MHDRYCVDSSSFLKIPEDYPTEVDKILAALDVLLVDGRLQTIRTVVEEVKRNLSRSGHRLETWLLDRKDKLLVEENDTFWLEGMKIVRDYPDIFDTHLNLIQADPLLIGVAYSKRMVLVTDEISKTHRRPKSQHVLHMPDVCAQLGVRSITLREFVVIENLS